MQSLWILETKTLITCYQFYLQKHKRRANSSDSFSRRKQMKKKSLRENAKNIQFLTFDQSFEIEYYGVIEIKLINYFLQVFLTWYFIQKIPFTQANISLS